MAGETIGPGALRGTLNGLLYFAAAEATSADSNTLRLPIDQCLDRLKVGLEDAPGLVVCVADVITGLMLFPTEITGKCHGPTPLLRRLSTTSPWMGGDATIASQVMTSC